MFEQWNDVRAVLPAWVGWSGLLYPVLFGGWAWLSGRACGAIALRRSCKLLGATADAPLHWTERARLWFGARQTVRGNLLGSLLVAAAFSATHDGPLQRMPLLLSGALLVLAAALGGWGAAFVLERRLRPQLKARTALAGVVSMSLVMYPHAIIGAVATIALPRRFEPGNMWAFGLVLALLISSAAGAGLWLGRALGLIRPASERVQRAVALAAEQLAHKPRAVYVLPLAYANAFAFPLLNSLAFTTIAEQVLQDEELTGIAAHEIGHLREPKWFQWSRAAIAVVLVAPLACCRALLNAYGIELVIAVVAAAVIASLLWRRVTRRMEAVADEAGHDSPAYARALERVYAENLAPAVLRGAGTTHPHLYDRMQAAGATPDYARPAPPPRNPLGLVALVFSFYMLALAPNAVYFLDVEHETTLHLRLMLHGDPSWELGQLARHRALAGDYESTAVLYRGALRASPDSYFYLWGLATTLRQLGRTTEALELVNQRLALPQSAQRRALELLKTILETPQPTAATSRALGSR